MTEKKPKRKSGPEPETLIIEGDWQEAARKAIRTPKPEGGWPEPPPREKPAGRPRKRKEGK